MAGSESVKPVVSKAVLIVKENQQQINGEFLQLQMLVCEKLQTKQINMQRFLYFIKGLFHCSDFIPASKKIDDIFEAITRNGLWDFLNYSPLQQIVKAFAKDDEEINARIHEYRHALAGYLAGTKLADHIAGMNLISEEVLKGDKPPCARKDHSYFEKLTLKLEARITEESMDYLIELWGNVSDYLGLPSLTYLLDDIHEGCISVMWLVPPIVIPTIVLKIDDPETAKFFSKLGIISMKMNDTYFYETSAKLEQGQEQVQSEIISLGIAENASKLEQPKHERKGGEWSDKQQEMSLEISVERENFELSEQLVRLKHELSQAQEEVLHLREKAALEKKEFDHSKEQLVSELNQAKKEAQKLRKQLQQATEEAPVSGIQVAPQIPQASLVIQDTDDDGDNVKLKGKTDLHLMDQPVRVIEGLSGPWRVTFSRSGQLIVTERGRISIFDGQGELVHRIESFELQQTRVELNPNGVTIADDGTLYMCDCDSDKLYKVSLKGEVLQSVGGRGIYFVPGKLDFEFPDGIALRNNKLYVCDCNNHRIQIFSCDLKFTGSFGSRGNGEGEFHWPADISFDQEDNLYVVEFGNHRVQVLSPSGTFLRTFGKYGSGPGELDHPMGIHVNCNTVYVSEQNNSRVTLFTTLGEFITTFGREGSEKGEFLQPHGITMDHGGYLYVCDSLNDRIQVFYRY